MKKELLLVGISLLLLCIGLVGCVKDQIPNEGSDWTKFLGTWNNNEQGISITFFTDGIATTNNTNYTWDVEEGNLILRNLSLSSQFMYTYAFSNNDQTLTLTNTEVEIGVVYTKQETQPL